MGDPLRDLPHLHALLDVVEQLATEGKANESRDALEHFWFDMYRPDAEEAPKDFDVDDEMAAFDAFVNMAGGMH